MHSCTARSIGISWKQGSEESAHFFQEPCELLTLPSQSCLDTSRKPYRILCFVKATTAVHVHQQ